VTRWMKNEEKKSKERKSQRGKCESD